MGRRHALPDRSRQQAFSIKGGVLRFRPRTGMEKTPFFTLRAFPQAGII
ncbi:hypothetical protein [Bacteroides caccae]